jgi:hypothetical protein
MRTPWELDGITLGIKETKKSLSRPLFSPKGKKKDPS